MIIEQNISLADMTSWGVGGPAENFCLPRSLSDIEEALAWADSKSLPVTYISGGSNVLVSDRGVPGLVVGLRRLSGTELREENDRLHITAWAGTAKSELLKIFLKYKLSPALFLAGLPGDVGGGVVMNAGVGEMITPREFVEITDWFEVLRFQNGQFSTTRYGKNQLQWEYRHCQGWQPGLITRVGLSWKLEPEENILDRVKTANKIRLGKQPLDKPSCGSVFKNPPQHKSAQLIESCGLKGFAIGGAQVSTKHANFIVNTGGAKALDMWTLIQHVRSVVKAQTGVDLTTEVIRLGVWD